MPARKNGKKKSFGFSASRKKTPVFSRVRVRVRVRVRAPPPLLWRNTLTMIKGGAAGKGKAPAVAVETKAKVVQETIVIEEGEKTLEDLIEEQRAKLHKEGKKARSGQGRV